MVKRITVSVTDSVWDMLLKNQRNKSQFILDSLIKANLTPKTENSVYWFRSSDLAGPAWGLMGT